MTCRAKGFTNGKATVHYKKKTSTTPMGPKPLFCFRSLGSAASPRLLVEIVKKSINFKPSNNVSFFCLHKYIQNAIFSFLYTNTFLPDETHFTYE